MAQGAAKKSANPGKAAKTNKTARSGGISKRPKPPKKTSADKLQRKLASAMVAKTEKMLGDRAGHLELLGKRDKAAAAAAAKKGDKVEPRQKGGSRKFG